MSTLPLWAEPGAKRYVFCARVENYLQGIADNTYDAVLCDPPYGYRFMGKSWDYDVPSVSIWKEVLRVLKPGGYMLACGGTRTFHRLVVNIEDAGFQVCDTLAWLYGQGMPHGKNISMAIDKAKGATRPVIGSRVLTGNAAISCKEKGGTYGVQVGSIPAKTVDVTGPATELAAKWEGWNTALKPAHEPIALVQKPYEKTYAYNAEKWGTGGINVDGCRVATDWSERSESWKRSGHSRKPEAEKIAAPPGIGINCHPLGRWPSNVLVDEASAEAIEAQKSGASLYFYCVKVSSSERLLGVTENRHPTLKPIALTTYLAKLIRPPEGAKILVPFAGAGSEVIGCLKAGWPEVTGVECEMTYCEIAEKRIAAHLRGKR